MSNPDLLLKYYLMKRTVLFYLWLFILYYFSYIYIMAFVTVYGFICIYTAYRNVGALEKILEPRANQKTWWFLCED